MQHKMSQVDDARLRLRLLKETENKILKERHFTMDGLVPWMQALRECRAAILAEENLIKEQSYV